MDAAPRQRSALTHTNNTSRHTLGPIASSGCGENEANHAVPDELSPRLMWSGQTTLAEFPLPIPIPIPIPITIPITAQKR